MTTLLFLATAILVILTTLACYFLYKVKQQQATKNALTAKNHAAWLENRNNLIKDIHFIANSMTQQQCEITEGCMRLEYLISKVDDSENIKSTFKHIYQHFNATANMPIREAYKALSKKEQFKLDNHRTKLEAENRTNVLNDTKQLAQYSFD